MATCVVCQQPFKPHRPQCQCCSSKCSAIHFRSINRPPSRAKQKECVICGVAFMAVPANRKTCGDECAAKLRSASSADLYERTFKGRKQVSEDELERRINELWERKAVPDYGRQRRSAITDIGL